MPVRGGAGCAVELVKGTDRGAPDARLFPSRIHHEMRRSIGVVLLARPTLMGGIVLHCVQMVIHEHRWRLHVQQ